jgi:hypothetical protein
MKHLISDEIEDALERSTRLEMFAREMSDECTPRSAYRVSALIWSIMYRFANYSCRDSYRGLITWRGNHAGVHQAAVRSKNNVYLKHECANVLITSVSHINGLFIINKISTSHRLQMWRRAFSGVRELCDNLKPQFAFEQ